MLLERTKEILMIQHNVPDRRKTSLYFFRKGLKSIVVNRTYHVINGESQGWKYVTYIHYTVPLKWGILSYYSQDRRFFIYYSLYTYIVEL